MKLKIFLLCLLLVKINFLNATTNEIDSALSVLKIQKQDSSKVNTLNFLCWKHSDLGEFEKTLAYANKAINISNKINYKKGARVAYNEIGIVYINTGDYNKAVPILLKATKIAFELKDSLSAAKSLTNIGNVYNRQSKYQESLKYYLQSLKIFEDLKIQPAMAQLYNNIGTIYMDYHEYISAEKYFINSLKIRTEINDESGISESFANLGFLFFKQNKNIEALNYLNKALVIKENLQEEGKCAAILMCIGRIYQRQKKYVEAIKVLDKAVLINTTLNDYPELAKAMINLSFINIDLKDYNAAKIYASKALKIAKEINENESLRYAYDAISTAEEGLGNYQSALLYHKLFKALTDSIFNIQNSEQLNNLKTEFEVQKKEQELKSLNKIEQAKKDAQIQKQKTIRNGFIIGLVLMLALAISIYGSYLQKGKANKLISKQKQEVEHQKEIVEHQNEEILSSITYAKRIQSTILPPQKVVKSYLVNSFILYLPKDIVAGDFYWMETVQFENEKQFDSDDYQNLKMENNDSNFQIDKSSNSQIVLFAACDCTGHGVPGALVSVVCSNALNRVVKENKIFNPATILDKVAELVVADFSKDENENVQDGMDISICALYKKKRILHWAGANNPLWIIRNGNLLEYKADKQPVGKYDGIKPFTNHEIVLEKDDTLYLFTDGYADQFGGEKNKKLTKAKYKELLLAIQHLSLLEQRNYLFEFHNSYRGSNEQVDDILVIGVKV